MCLVGFLDDDINIHGHVLNGLFIYNPKDLEELVLHKGVTEVLLAMPSATRERRNEILASIHKLKITVRTLPRLSDIVSGKVTFNDVRELDIDDLLERDPIKPINLLLNRHTHNKTVLVTGAGGSIGSELCIQVMKTLPKLLLLVDMSEFALYKIHEEIQLALHLHQDSPFNDLKVIPLLASVFDEKRMNEIMETWKPDTVYHSAAYKHVPLVEHNPAEAIRNNVWGTKVMAEAAIRNGVHSFVLISTDKAVRPTNIMGATKRLAEMLLQTIHDEEPTADFCSLADRKKVKKGITCFSIVRFGNVLGSSGSVVPLFRKQIKDGGPITLTHSDMTRYLMTIPEAAQLVIQAGAMCSGRVDVFVLDMGIPVRIYDLASRMVKLSGLTVKSESNPHGDIEIKITGVRPGEKLYEELLTGNSEPTQHPRILRSIEGSLPRKQLHGLLKSLELALSVNDVPMIIKSLLQLVNDYQPAGDVVDWVYLEQCQQSCGNRLWEPKE